MNARPIRLTRIPPAGWILLAAAVLGLHLSSRLYVEDLAGWDAAQYYRMAETPALVPVEAPFAYRWLPHKAVALIPILPPKRSYELVTWAALLLAALGIARILTRLNLSPWTAASMAILFVLWAKWGGRFYVWYRAGSDPLAYAIIAWGWVCILEKRLLALTLLGAVGVACREHVALLFPAYAAAHAGSAERMNWRPLLYGAIAALPAAATLVAIRIVTPVTNDFSLAAAVQQTVAEKLLTSQGLLSTLSALLTHSGMLFPLLLLGGRRTVRAARRHPGATLWIVMTLGVGLFGGRDTDRLMYYAVFGELILLAECIRTAPRPDPVWIALAALFHIILSQTFDAALVAANVAPIRPLTEALVFTVLLAGAWKLAKPGEVAP